MAGYIGSKASVVSSGAERKKTFTITGATTSLTGLNYTVGKVHVFQNGVRLVDGTDYTATNGTTITLTVAAQSGDNVVVISQASYQVALSGIDDQSNATALTIDSSENVMVGVASVQTQSGTTAGTSLYGGDNAGLITAGRNGDILRLNRQSSNGDIALFKKDGTTVGSIAVDPSNIAIGSGDTGIYFNSGDDALIPVGTSGNLLSSRDNAIDLGRTSTRFKDAYIGGGVYLGGTGAANKLDDYEFGSGNATITGSGGGTITTNGDKTYYYTKIGDLVHFQVEFTITSTSGCSGATQIALPVQSRDYVAGSLRAYLATYTGNSLFCEAHPAGNQVLLKSQSSGNASHDVLSNTTSYYFVTLTYLTY